jgi:hypothetical protein
LAVLLSGSLAPATAQVTFEQYEVVTGPAERQTIVPGFFLGGAVADLALVKIDENGDRRADFLVGKSREELHLFLGVPGPELLAPQPQEVAVALPGDERNSWLVDLLKDGKQDLLMHHASATEAHRLTILIAR